MPEYLSPGVYVEEKDAGPKPIQGVSTSTSGAVGVTLRGPSEGKPELVTSFADFVRKFGGYIPELLCEKGGTSFRHLFQGANSAAASASNSARQALPRTPPGNGGSSGHPNAS